MQDAEPQRRTGMSGLAITAFVLSLVLGLLSLVGIWWVNGIPLLFAVFAWPGISSGRRRGAGFAIAASVLSVVGAVGVFLMYRGVASVLEQSFHKYMTALENGDAEELAKWMPEGEDATAAVPRWKDRMDKVHDAGGKSAGPTTGRAGGFGPAGSLGVAPEGVVAIDDSGPKPTLAAGEAYFWFEASFERGDVWVAIGIPGGRRSGFTGQQLGAVRDVRFFRKGAP